MQAPNIIAQVLERMMPVGSIVEWAPVDSGDTDLSTPAKVADCVTPGRGCAAA